MSSYLREGAKENEAEQRRVAASQPQAGAKSPPLLVRDRAEPLVRLRRRPVMPGAIDLISTPSASFHVTTTFRSLPHVFQNPSRELVVSTSNGSYMPRRDPQGAPPPVTMPRGCTVVIERMDGTLIMQHSIPVPSGQYVFDLGFPPPSAVRMWVLPIDGIQTTASVRLDVDINVTTR
jgi:hypothetical protein